MGRKQKAEHEKAVKGSVTFPPELHEELQRRTTQKRKFSQVVSGSLTWYLEVMDTVGYSLDAVFEYEEIKILLFLVNQLLVEPGRIGALQRKFSNLLKREELDGGMLTKEVSEELREKFTIPLGVLQRKLARLEPFEALWLYERLLQAQEEGWSVDKERLKSLFRCR
jgi:hypothetical protein